MPEAGHFSMLDGSAAAILVVLFHLAQAADQWVAGGYLAADFFFALSGSPLGPTAKEVRR